MSILGHIKTDIETAYDLYSDLLYRIALTQLQNNEDAQDAVQDVFMRYINSSPILRDADHERAWFIRTTVNRCHDILRHKKIREHIAIDDVANVIPDNSKYELQSEIISILSSLDEKYRIAITLHHLEGFSVKEIASMLRISESSVKMRLTRGRDSLKNIIEKEGYCV